MAKYDHAALSMPSMLRPYGVRATKVVDRDSQVVYRLEFGADFPKAIGCRRIGTDTWAVAVSPQ